MNNEIIIDNFSGGGGASTGIELALGRHVDVAINHDLHSCDNTSCCNPHHLMLGTSVSNRREKLVEQETEFLMSEGQEYYPFSIKNFTEALQNFRDSSYTTLAAFAGIAHNLHSNCAVSSMLANSVVGLVVDYWRPLAGDEAERTVPCVEEIMGDES